MNYVFDSSSLIYLGKLNILEKINILEGKKYIPESVYREVVSKGFERGENEAEYIEKLIKNKHFIVKNVKILFEDLPYLSTADKEVLSLAKEIKATAIIDELYATTVASSHNINCHGSIYMILLLLNKKIINKEETINYIDKMIRLGFYLSAEKYKEILELIKNI